ncbi:MAG: SPFH domain-containing protein [Roseiflexaceae bacterium]|jgi:regulator of protease activity HflC (stomatin/prohibitin superfamily)|nr:SPFH domain-containing protein [Chloroflexaceae bacterium]MCE2852076.1 SPFH domain-containing protein [Chloroflexaceae bacterium]
MNMQSRVVGIVALIAVILALGASTTRFAQIDEGTRGIIVTQGAVESIQEPGLFFRPFAPFTRVEIVNVRRQSRQIQQNVASSDKQLYDINIQVDYSRKTSPDALRTMYGRLGVSDEQLNNQLDGFISEALKSASTQFTLDQALSDRGGFSQRIRQYLTTSPGENQEAPVDQLYVNLEAVKVIDISVGEQYAKLLEEKANLEVQIETEEKRRQQIEAEQANNLFRAEQEAKVALTTEKGRTAAAIEAASRESQVRTVQGQSFRQNPELLRLRERELMVEMMKNGNIWFVDPNTNLTLLLDNLAANNPAVTQQIIRETGVITTTP